MELRRTIYKRQDHYQPYQAAWDYGCGDYSQGAFKNCHKLVQG